MFSELIQKLHEFRQLPAFTAPITPAEQLLIAIMVVLAVAILLLGNPKHGKKPRKPE